MSDENKDTRLPDRDTLISVTVSEGLVTDLVNSLIALRYLSEHYHRLDWLGRANIDNAADAIQEFTDLVNSQHPLPDLGASQVVVIEREAVTR